MLRQIITELTRLLAGGEFDGARSGVAIGAVALLGIIVFVFCSRSNTASADLERHRREALETVAKVFQIDVHTGFLAPDPLHRLPSSSYNEWEKVMDELPELNAAGKLQETVLQLPKRSFDDIRSPRELHRAHVVLSMLVQSYVNGPVVPWHLSTSAARIALKQNGIEVPSEVNPEQQHKPKVLPSVLAVPFHTVCTRLGMTNFICCAATFDTWNWKKLDPSRPLSVGNVRLISRMSREPAELGFHAIPCAMQARAGPIICRLFLVDVAIELEDITSIVGILDDLTKVFQDFRSIFAEVANRVDPSGFYDIYRPLLGGFYPDGIVFEGVSAPDTTNASPEGHLVCHSKGPSAGQSTMIVLFDLALGITHRQESKEFQTEMLEYMPGPHKVFCEIFAQKLHKVGSIKDFVQKCNLVTKTKKIAEAEMLSAAYTHCVDAFHRFRQFHLGVATKYLIKTSTGTGSSDFRSMLREALDDTNPESLQCPAFKPTDKKDK